MLIEADHDDLHVPSNLYQPLTLVATSLEMRSATVVQICSFSFFCDIQQLTVTNTSIFRVLQIKKISRKY